MHLESKNYKGHLFNWNQNNKKKQNTGCTVLVYVLGSMLVSQTDSCRKEGPAILLLHTLLTFTVITEGETAVSATESKVREGAAF